MHLDKVSYEDLLRIGKFATGEGETLSNMNLDSKVKEVADALIVVNILSNK